MNLTKKYLNSFKFSIAFIKRILNLNEFNKKIFLLNSSKKTVSISTLFTS